MPGREVVSGHGAIASGSADQGVRMRQIEDDEKKARTKSPLKAKPMRSPGQSLGELRRELFDDHLILPTFMVVGFMTVAVIMWSEELTGRPQSPWLWTFCFAIALLYWVYRFAKILPLVRRIRQGEAGEKVVGEFLEALRAGGYKVFHDVLADGFNVDHVLIGPAGVFSIETKTWNKPTRGEPRIEFDGQALRVLSKGPDRNPIIQARAQAGWLRGILNESTGQQVTVLPVILIPGWFIRLQAKPDRPIWVLEPKALPKWLENEPNRLTEPDINLLASHLARYIRASELEKERSDRSFWHGIRRKRIRWDD